MIGEFNKEYSFLSNFYRCTPCLVYEGIQYASVEHGYQALKAASEKDFDAIRSVEHPGTAKKMGNSVALRSDWETVKMEIMYGLLRAKFELPFFMNKLMSTGDQELIEGNYWGDKFWGVCLRTNEGANHLGQLLMMVREEISNDIKSGKIVID